MEPPSLSWGSCTRTASVSILPPAWGVWRLPRPLTRVLHTSPETSPWTHGTFALEELLKQRDQCVLISPQGSLGTLQRGEEEGRDFRNSHDQHTQRPAPLGNSEDGIP